MTSREPTGQAISDGGWMDAAIKAGATALLDNLAPRMNLVGQVRFHSAVSVEAANAVLAAALPHIRSALADDVANAARLACREWPEGADNYCFQPAAFILWGKLFPPEALGPRCPEHAQRHVSTDAHSIEQSAVFDLRPFAAARVARGGPLDA